MIASKKENSLSVCMGLCMNIFIKISFIFLIQVTDESYTIFQGLQKMTGKGIAAVKSP